MKKLVALLAVLTMLVGIVPVSFAAESEPVTAWLLYFAAPGWWPQHQKMDQPSSETGVEATNAQITGPGKYTVGLKFNWQTAESALQFNLILDNAEKVMPGLYVDITDIRVNGTSIEMKADNMYGTFHDDTESGFAPIYNNYWNAVETPGSTGPDPATMRAFDGTLDTESYEIIDPSAIKAGSTIEVDFIVAEGAGEIPEELGAAPKTYVGRQAIPETPIPENATTAYLYYQAGGYWPVATPEQQGDYTTVTLTGEGHYTVSAYFVDQGGWTPSGNGAEKFLLVVDDVEGSTVDGMRMGIADVRVNGESIDFNNACFGPTGYDDTYNHAFDSKDGYAILYDSYMTNQPTPWGHETWDDKAGTVNVVDPADLANVKKVEVDFFFTSKVGTVPAKEEKPFWYGNNTVGVAGLSMSDLGLANDWHNIVPVDVSKTGWNVYTLVASDAHVIGHALVAVNNGNVTVTFDYAEGDMIEHSQCIKWFTNLEDITVDALKSTEGGLTDEDVVNVANDLGGVDIAYLSINNKVSWCSVYNPVLNQTLPRYWRNLKSWIDYRAELTAMIPVAEEAVAE